MTGSFAKKMKALTKLAALAAGFAFSFQSAVLPIHAAAHALQNTIQLTEPSNDSITTDSVRTSTIEVRARSAANVAHLSDADCALCDLSTHQAVSPTAILNFDSVEPVVLRGETLPLLATFTRLAHLPPVRGPPAHT